MAKPPTRGTLSSPRGSRGAGAHAGVLLPGNLAYLEEKGKKNAFGRHGPQMAYSEPPFGPHLSPKKKKR